MLRTFLTSVAFAAALGTTAPASACAAECDPCDNLWDAVHHASLGVVPDRDWSCIDTTPQ